MRRDVAVLPTALADLNPYGKTRFDEEPGVAHRMSSKLPQHKGHLKTIGSETMFNFRENLGLGKKEKLIRLPVRGKTRKGFDLHLFHPLQSEMAEVSWRRVRLERVLTSEALLKGFRYDFCRVTDDQVEQSLFRAAEEPEKKALVQLTVREIADRVC
jgi:hypothetical protein